MITSTLFYFILNIQDILLIQFDTIDITKILSDYSIAFILLYFVINKLNQIEQCLQELKEVLRNG